MPTAIYSFGYKWGLPDAPANSLIIDVRQWLKRNPYHDKKLRPLDGTDPAVQADVMRNPDYSSCIQMLKTMCQRHNGPVYVGCAGGRHRSVTVAIVLGGEFGIPVTHLHKDLKRE